MNVCESTLKATEHMSSMSKETMRLFQSLVRRQIVENYGDWLFCVQRKREEKVYASHEILSIKRYVWINLVNRIKSFKIKHIPTMLFLH